MGQAQIGRASKLISDGLFQGNWVVIENCHVDDSWLNKLEAICLNISTSDNVNEDFRLWLTSCPSEEFPMIILQMASKINMEQPAGVKENASLLLSSQPWLNVESCSNELTDDSQLLWQRCVFSLVLFHAIVKERTSFSPLGWNIPYEFYEMDLITSLVQLNVSLGASDRIPMEGHTLLIGDCNYGGRVTDERDRHLLATLLDQIFNSSSINEDSYTYSEFGNICVPSVPTKIANPNIFAELDNYAETTLIGLNAISVFDQDYDESFEVCFSSLSIHFHLLHSLMQISDNFECFADTSRNRSTHLD